LESVLWRTRHYRYVSFLKWRIDNLTVPGLGIGFMITVGPLYLGENVVPELRGCFLCTINSSICLGRFLIACVSRGAVDIEGPWQYRAPLLTMFTFNILVLAFWPWFPESPYYMISHSNDPEGCRRSFRRLYGPWQTDEFVDNEVICLQHCQGQSSHCC
jgi:hypothetical protein